MFWKVAVGILVAVIAFSGVTSAKKPSRSPQAVTITNEMVRAVVGLFCEHNDLVSLYQSFTDSGLEAGISVAFHSVLLAKQERRLGKPHQALNDKDRGKIFAAHDWQTELLRRKLADPEVLIALYNLRKPKLMQSLSACDVRILAKTRAELERMFPFFAGTIPEDQMILLKLGIDAEREMHAGKRKPSEVLVLERELREKYDVTPQDIHTAAWVEDRMQENPKLPETYALLIHPECQSTAHDGQNADARKYPARRVSSCGLHKLWLPQRIRPTAIVSVSLTRVGGQWSIKLPHANPHSSTPTGT